MLVIQHHGTVAPIKYKHVINPVKYSGQYEPNWIEYNRIKTCSALNILEEDFKKVQKRGEIIIVNQAGGWCTMTYGMDVLEGEELLDKELVNKK